MILSCCNNNDDLSFDDVIVLYYLTSLSGKYLTRRRTYCVTLEASSLNIVSTIPNDS